MSNDERILKSVKWDWERTWAHTQWCLGHSCELGAQTVAPKYQALCGLTNDDGIDLILGCRGEDWCKSLNWCCFRFWVDFNLRINSRIRNTTRFATRAKQRTWAHLCVLPSANLMLLCLLIWFKVPDRFKLIKSLISRTLLVFVKILRSWLGSKF